MTYLRQADRGSHLATSVGSFRVVRYEPVTDRVEIRWDRFPDVVAWMSGASLLSFMVFVGD